MALSNHPIDGSLCTWQEVVAGHEDWSALLLGNGLSRHVWGDFGYASLFDEAQQGDSPGSLTAEDLKLFSALSTKNFERVLADLATTIRVAEALGVDSRLFVERYQSIQRALGMAVRSVHVNRAGIRDETLEGIGRVLQAQEYVFTTSYDLIVYWAMGAVDYRGLCDCFWGSDRSFDPLDADVNSDSTPVYFLHGALHLVVMGSGVGSRR